MSISDETLEAWEEARAKGYSRRRFADELGISMKALDNRIRRASRRRREGNPGGADEPRPQSGKAQFVEIGNRAEAVSESDRIKSPEDLIEYLQIDIEVWEIERCLVNKWEGYRKSEKKSIQYEDGKATGYIEDSGELTTAPLFQVKLWLVKKKPEPLHPVISPVRIEFAPQPPADLPERKTGKKSLILFDKHFGFYRDFRTGALTPFHDRTALSIALQIAEYINPDTVVFGGDTVDLPDMSDKFLRSPEMRWTTQPALVEAAWFIGRIKGNRKALLLGNHGKRLEIALLKHFNQAYDLRPADRLNEPPPMTLGALLGLDGMNVEYVDAYPDGYYRVSEGTEIIHGHKVKQTPGATATAIIKDTLISVGFGHIHRAEQIFKTVWRNGRPGVISAFCPGCLCKIDGTVPGSGRNQNWQQGLAIVDHTGENEHIEIVSINNGSATYNGIEFIGIPYTEELREMEFFSDLRLNE